MVGKEPYETDAGGIGFLFPFRYLSRYMNMKMKNRTSPPEQNSKAKESNQISGLPDTLMMTDYKGRTIKMFSDMANEKIQEPT